MNLLNIKYLNIQLIGDKSKLFKCCVFLNIFIADKFDDEENLCFTEVILFLTDKLWFFDSIHYSQNVQ